MRLLRNLPVLYEAGVALCDTYSLLQGARRGTYSQHAEDVFASNFFGARRGFYLDIGASHPFRISNTYLLYRQGWSGVTVEPIPRLAALHKKWRPRDTLMPVAVGHKKGSFDFFEMTPSVLSTLDAAVAEQYVTAGRAVVQRRYQIQTLPINDVFEFASSIAPIEFLSLDIEGLDAAMVSEIDFVRFRPTLICVEFNTETTKVHLIELFQHAGYDVVKELGCNILASPRERTPPV